MNLRKTLAAYFLPTRRLIGNEGTPVQKGGAMGGQEWVVPRGDCQYRRLDLTAMPARQREAAARLALAAQLPSSSALSSMGWKAGIGHAWIWIDPPGDIVPAQRAWIPESLLVPLPDSDGVRLLQMSSGVEAQVWHAGQLAASQWWSQLPDAEVWGRFLRSAGLDQGTPLPAVQSFAWLAEPWAEQKRSWVPGSTEARERLAWVGVVAVLALLVGWQLTSSIRWDLASSRLAAQLEAARTEVAPVLAARERAEQAQAEAQRLLQLQVGISDYALMSQVVAALPEGVQLGTWRREPGKIEALIKGGASDPRTYVSAFVGQPALANVTATQVAAGMQLTFVLSDQVEGAAR